MTNENIPAEEFEDFDLSNIPASPPWAQVEEEAVDKLDEPGEPEPVFHEDEKTGHIFGPVEDPVEERRRGRPSKIDPLTIEKTAREESMEEAAALLFRLQKGNLTKRQEQERKEQLLKTLAELDEQDFSHFLADEEVQKAVQSLHLVGNTGKPGDPILDEKGREISRVPWNAQAQMDVYEMVEWTPMRTDTIEVNGVAWRVWEGIPCKTPNIIRDVAQESYRQTKLANDMQKSFIEDSVNRFADGVTTDVGWRKMSTEELEAMPGNRRV